MTAAPVAVAGRPPHPPATAGPGPATDPDTDHGTDPTTDPDTDHGIDPTTDPAADDGRAMRWGARLVTAGLVANAFAGHWGDAGVPVPLDRPALWLGVALCTAAHLRRGGRPALRPVHVLLVLALAWATLSAISAGTFRGEGLYALVDRFGVLPFALYLAAPVVYAGERARRLLLRSLALLALYLAVVSIAQFTGLDALVWPRYILDPAVGLHLDRARGPYVEAVANGMMLVMTGAAAGVVAATDRRRSLRLLAAVTLPLAGVAVFMTLTRAVWVGAVVVAAVVALVVPCVRRLAVPLAAVLGPLGLLAWTVVPGLSERAQERTGDQWPLWDRLNTNAAALRMIDDHPLTGIGWHRSADVVLDYVRQGATYPVTQARIEIHDVFLSRAAELGLVGFGLWAAALVAALVFPLLRRPDGPSLQPWRIVLLAALTIWAVAALFGPVPYPQPTYLLWCLGGLVLGPYLAGPPRRPRGTAAAPDPVPDPRPEGEMP